MTTPLCLYIAQNRNEEQTIWDKFWNYNSKIFLMPFVLSFLIYKQFKYMVIMIKFNIYLKYKLYTKNIKHSLSTT
jgi:hypothetical protein